MLKIEQKLCGIHILITLESICRTPDKRTYNLCLKLNILTNRYGANTEPCDIYKVMPLKSYYA